MSPLIFELIMYLKANRRLWNLDDVVEANKRRKNNSAAVKKRLKDHRQRVTAKKSSIADWDKFHKEIAEMEKKIEEELGMGAGEENEEEESSLVDMTGSDADAEDVDDDGDDDGSDDDEAKGDEEEDSDDDESSSDEEVNNESV